MDIAEVVAKNVQWLHGSYHLGEFPEFTDLRLAQIKQVILGSIPSSEPLAQITSLCDNRLGLWPGTSLTAVRHLIATRRWVVDMQVPLEPSKPLRILGTSDDSLNSTSTKDKDCDSLNQLVA
jgi:hypothetical protein